MKKFISLLLAFSLILTSSVLATVQDDSSNSGIVATLKNKLQSYIDSNAFSDAIQTCRELRNTGLLTLRESRYYGNLIRELDDKQATFKDTKLRNILDSYLFDNSYIKAIEFCTTTLQNENLSDVDRKYFEQAIINVKDKFNKYLNSKIASYINSNLYNEAIRLCEDSLNSTYISEEQKTNIETKIEDLKNKSTEYYTKELKPKIQTYMNSKLYVGVIQTCQTVLDNVWLSPEEYIYLNTTLNEAKSKYNEFMISEVSSYMDSKLYIEAIQVCEEVIGKNFLSSDDNKYFTQKLSEARSKYNEYRIRNQKSKVKSYMDSKLYIEVIQACEEVIGKNFLSSDDNKYFTQKLSEARSKYNEYRVRNQKLKSESYMNSKLYVETIQTCEEALSWNFLSSDDRSYFESLRQTAKNKYNEYIYKYNEAIEKKRQANRSKTVTNSQKQKIFAIVKSFISPKLISSATAIWPSYNTPLYFYDGDGLINIMGELEAMNRFGGYGKIHFIFRFDESFNMHWYNIED